MNEFSLMGGALTFEATFTDDAVDWDRWADVVGVSKRRYKIGFGDVVPDALKRGTVVTLTFNEWSKRARVRYRRGDTVWLEDV